MLQRSCRIPDLGLGLSQFVSFRFLEVLAVKELPCHVETTRGQRHPQEKPREQNGKSENSQFGSGERNYPPSTPTNGTPIASKALFASLDMIVAP